LARDIKSLAKSNVALLKKLKADEAVANKELTADLHALLKPSAALAKKAAIDGNLLTKNPAATVLARATTEQANLGTITSSPLATLNAALAETTLTTDLNALASANPGDAAVAADVATATSQISAQHTAISSAAAQFVTDVNGLATDLSSVISSVPAGTSSQNAISDLAILLPKLTGSATYTRGVNLWGSEDDLTIHINDVDRGGNISGNLSGGFTTDDVSSSLHDAKVTAAGKFSAKVVTSIISYASISGQFTINQATGAVTLKGTFKDGLTEGRFTAST
jgi:hypothetical protein